MYEFKQVHKELEDTTGQNRELKTSKAQTEDEGIKISTDLHQKEETLNEVTQDLKDKEY